MKQKEKDILIESLKSLEMGIIEGQKRGVYTLPNARVLMNSIEALNSHLMDLPVDPEEQKKDEKK